MEENKKYTAQDFKSDQYVRWCPGCGDHAIVNALQRAMAEVGVAPHKTAVISGIGCAYLIIWVPMASTLFTVVVVLLHRV